MDETKSTDLVFLHNLFKKFVPAVGNTKKGNKKSKRPLFTGWLNVTEEQSAELARHVDYKDGPFMFLTGKSTNYFAVDLDVRDPSRQDHVNKKDGLEHWHVQYDEPEYMNTLIVGTPTGGRHLVYKYEDGITSGQLEKDVLIDILSDGRGMFFDPKHYEILNKVEPISASPKLVQNIIYNNFGQITYNDYGTKMHDFTREINAIAGCDLTWDVVKSEDSKAFTLIPETYICCVEPDYTHSECKHSRFVVTKTNVVARCFSHTTQRTVKDDVSQRLRELFFPGFTSFEDFMNGVMTLCSRSSFFRLDGFVLKAKRDTPWIYERVASYDEFINTHFSSNQVFMRNPRRFADVVKYMEIVDHESFPFIRKNTDYMGFDNCVVNITTHEVMTDVVIMPRHSLRGSFSWDSTNTPLFDSVVKYQLRDDVVYTYFLAFIGRLFYKVKAFDNYNIVPLIKGDSGTGKSTVLTVIKKMFSAGAVGVLNSNNESTFGLEAKYDKELLIAHEIGDRLTDRLSSDLFKQMVCGEDISIPRKNKPAIDVTWSVPMFLCSNVYLTYTDIQGSISRRLAIFKFDRYVAKKDITLETRIIDTELPALIAKCLRAYKTMLEHITDRSFWDVCPEYFNENTREMSEQTDYIYMYLTMPPGDNVYGDKDVYFMHKEGASMLLQQFKNMFINYMRFKHPNVKYRWTSDYSSFNRLGYNVVYCHVCKGCGTHAKVGCCEQYSLANRSRRYVIENLCLVENAVDSGVTDYSL